MTRTTVLQAVRTLFVWAANLLLHALGPPHLGEPLELWSLLQAGGFALAAAGVLVYSRGDDERARWNLQLEAALIMLDQPPRGPGSVAGSVYSTWTWRTAAAAAVAGLPAGGSPTPGGGGGGGGGGDAGGPWRIAGDGGSSGRGAGAGAGAYADFDVGSIGRSMLQGVPQVQGASPSQGAARARWALRAGDGYYGDALGAGSSSEASPPFARAAGPRGGARPGGIEWGGLGVSPLPGGGLPSPWGSRPGSFTAVRAAPAASPQSQAAAAGLPPLPPGQTPPRT
jgi:hypothetical protein